MCRRPFPRTDLSCRGFQFVWRLLGMAFITMVGLGGQVLEEAIALKGVSAWGLRSACGLYRVKTTRMAFVPSSVLGRSRTAQCQVPYPTHECGPLASHWRALGEGIRTTYKWPTWEGFPYGTGFNSMWLLFPFKLDSGWESFLSGGSQLPRCCNLFLCFCREVFFFHLQDFCHQKNTFELCVPS